MKARRSIALASAVAVLVTATAANAEPTVWAKAKSPTLARETAALEANDQEFARAQVEYRTTLHGFGIAPPEDAERIHNLRVLRAYEKAGGERSTNPLFLTRFADVLHEVGEDGRALLVAKRVLASDARPDVKVDASFTVAFAFARLGRVDDEIAAYDTGLLYQPEGKHRGGLFENQAEAYMVKGDVTRAVSGYRAANNSSISVTAYWGLGVALDRSGDLAGGLESIAIARSYDPGDKSLQPPIWEFIPPYNASWYAALGELLVARNAKAQSVREAAYDQAVEDWRDYVKRAGDKDPYVGVALARLKLTQKELNDFHTAIERRKKERAEKHLGPSTDDGEPEETLTVHPLPVPH